MPLRKKWKLLEEQYPLQAKQAPAEGWWAEDKDPEENSPEELAHHQPEAEERVAEEEEVHLEQVAEEVEEEEVAEEAEVAEEGPQSQRQENIMQDVSLTAMTEDFLNC